MLELPIRDAENVSKMRRSPQRQDASMPPLSVTIDTSVAKRWLCGIDLPVTKGALGRKFPARNSAEHLGRNAVAVRIEKRRDARQRSQAQLMGKIGADRPSKFDDVYRPQGFSDIFLAFHVSSG